MAQTVSKMDSEVTERLNGECGIYEQGNSRVVTVPSNVGCEKGDGVQTFLGQKDGCGVYILVLMSSLGVEKERIARRAAISESGADTDVRCDCEEIRLNSPSKIATIPSQSDDKLYGAKTSQTAFVGEIDGELAYLKFVPSSLLELKLDGAAI